MPNDDSDVTAILDELALYGLITWVRPPDHAHGFDITFLLVSDHALDAAAAGMSDSALRVYVGMLDDARHGRLPKSLTRPSTGTTARVWGVN